MPIVFTTVDGNALRQAQTDGGANPIDGVTLAQALNYLDTNVTTLATAKTYLRELTKVVFIQERRLDRIEAALLQYKQSRG